MDAVVIDIRTVILVSTIILVCRAALLAYAWVINRTYRPVRYWAVGATLAAFGVLLLGLRGIVPLTASVMFGQAGLLIGWLFISAGTITAAEREPPWRLGFSITAAALAGAFCFLLVWPDYLLRTIVVSLPGLMFDSYSIYVSLRFVGGRWRTVTFRILALVLSVSIVSSMVKNLYVLRSGSSSIFDSNVQSTQYYVLSTVILIVCTVLYVLLGAQKTQEELGQEIDQRKQMEDQVRQLAFHDTLTNLPNRRLLMDRLAQAMAVGKRSDSFGALMFMDLDNFKPLNDQRGHAVGDLLLVEVARRLTACVRATDTVSRVGGDEFVVLLCDLTTDQVAAAELANKLAEKVRVSLSQAYRLPGGNEATTIEHYCSASIGVVLFSKEHQDLDNLLKWADATMYRSKKEGRNRISFMTERRAEQRI
jgi:diguanylate cyclase (GGDEF)-like protein